MTKIFKYNYKAYCHTKQYIHIGKTCKTYLFKSENTMQETQEKENIKHYPLFHSFTCTLRYIATRFPYQGIISYFFL